MLSSCSRTTVLVCLVLCSGYPALALPRDAVAVLNRCGKPMKGDETILDNSVAGGHRTLRYERGYLHFDKVAQDGWSFVSGEHHRKTDLSADEMEVYMPCLKDALADSAAPEPIKQITSVNRLESTAKRDYKQIVFGALALIIFSGLALAALSRRKPLEVEEF